MAVPFDLETLEVTGNQSTVLPTMTVFSGGASQYGFSDNGTLIYASEGQVGSGQGRQLAAVDMEGNETLLPLPPGELDAPRYSPDGSMIAYQDGTDIRIYNVITGASPQFTSGVECARYGHQLGIISITLKVLVVRGFEGLLMEVRWQQRSIAREVKVG